MNSHYQQQTLANSIRVGVVFTAFAALAACGMLNSGSNSQDPNGSNPSGTTQNSNTVQNGNSPTMTQAVQLAGAAAQVTSQQTNAFVNAGQQTPACQNIATQLGQTVTQTVQDMQQSKDCTQDLQSFVGELQQLITCMDGNSTTGVSAPQPPTGTANPNDCNSTMDPNGNQVTVCDTGSCHCTTHTDPNGSVVETCTATGTASGSPTTGNPNSIGNPNSVLPVDPNTTTGVGSNPVLNPNQTGVGSNPVLNPNQTGVGANPNQGSPIDPNSGASGQQCSTKQLPGGGTTVTCTCSTMSGTCTATSDSHNP